MSIRSCREFEARLEEAAELRIAPAAAELEPHARSCRPCRRLWHQSMMLERAIAAWKDDPTLAVVDTNFRVQPARVPKHPRTARLAGWGVTIAASAALVLAALSDRAPEHAPAIAQLDTTNNIERPASTRLEHLPHLEQIPEDDVDLLVQDAGSAYLALVTDVSGAASAAGLLMPSESDWDPNSSADSNEVSHPAWLEGWPEPLSPTQKRVGEAFDFLLEVIPNEEPATSVDEPLADASDASVRPRS